jgi:adenylate kinase
MSAVEIKVGRKLAALVPFNNQIVDPRIDLHAIDSMRAEAAKKMAQSAEANGYTLVVIDEAYSIKTPGAIDSLLPEDVDPDISVMKFTGLAANA